MTDSFLVSVFLLLEFQHQVIRKLNIVSHKVDQISSDILNILEILNKRGADTQAPAEEKQNVLFDFPITSEEDMCQLEKHLEDNANLKLLVNILLAFLNVFLD